VGTEWNRQSFSETLGPPFPGNGTGYPDPGSCSKYNWPEYYFSYALGSAVQNLYKNYNGLADSFTGYWETVATTFSGGNNILGYELMNEPWAGDIYTDPELILPGVADLINLQPFYANISAGIRTIDTDHMIFFEGITWDDGISGFTQVPGGDAYRNRSALTFHYYSPPNLTPQEQFETFYLKAIELETGWFLSETFGGPEVYHEADRYFQSWLNWEYKAFVPRTGFDYGFWNPNGTLNNNTISNLTRTYARAIAGKGVNMTYNDTTFDFQLAYRVNSNCTLPTEIYLNAAMHYPNGVQVTLEPSNVGATWSQVSPNEIFIFTNVTVSDDTLIVVSISPQ